MAQSGFTPIQLFRTTTAAAVPTAGSLADGELAINLTDEKLYFKNASGTVKLLASSGGAAGTVTSVDVSGGTTGLTFSGGPITSSGTITMAGTLGVANGGTGATSFTSGYLLKGNGTSAVSSSVIYDDGTNVGIGTAAPGYKLDVAGQSRAYNTPSSFAQLQSLTQYTGSAAPVGLGQGSDATGYLINLANAGMAFGTNGSERMRIASGGFVGIGTASPSSKLTVLDGDIEVSATGLGNTLLSFNGTTANLTVNSSSAPLVFGTSSTERMRITSAGNVGIGTSSVTAGYKLDISGSANASGSFVSGGGTTNQTLVGNKTLLFYNTSVSEGVIQSADDTSTFTSVGISKDVVRFATQNSERMRIDGSGNVGIGTTSPGAKLHVVGGPSTLTLTNTDAASFAGVAFTDGTNTKGQIWVGNGSYASFGGAGSINYSANSGPHVWYTNYAERMRIDGSGNVGIGTSSPVKKLVVSNAGANGFEIEPGEGNYNRLISYNRSTSAYTPIYLEGSEQYFFAGSGAEAMRITSAGSVGIGITSPGALLAVNTASTPGVGLIVQASSLTASQINMGIGVITAGYPFIGTNTSTNPLQFGVRDATDVIFVTSAAEKMRLTSGGNLLIGTTTSQGKLSVNSATGNVGFNTGTSSSPERGNLWYDTDGTGWKFNIGKRQSGSFTAQMTIQDDGSVGIGTTSPSTILHVAGSSVTEVRVTSSGNLTTGAASLLRFGGSNSATSGYIGYGGTASTIDLWNTLAGSLTFGTSNLERMRITSGGQLLSGTTTAVNAGGVFSTAGTNVSTTVTKNSNMTGMTLVATDNVNTMTGLWFGVGNAVHWSGIAGGRTDNASHWGTHLSFYTHANDLANLDNANERMRITGDGSVGIGTTSPVTKLHVAGAGNVTGGNIHLGDNTDGAAKWTYITGAHYNGATNPTGISMIGTYATSTDNNVVIGGQIYEAHPATLITFFTHTATTHSTGGSERMRIDSSGNVAIGTSTTTGAKFTVAGGNGILVNGNGASGYNVTQFINDGSITMSVGVSGSTAAGWSQNLAHLGTTSNSPVAFGTNSTERARIHASGGVSIGNTVDTGAASLNVSGDAVFQNRVYTEMTAPAVKSASATLTGAEVMQGYLQTTGSASPTYTLPTGADLQAAMPASVAALNDISFDFTVIHTGTNVPTLATSTGITAVGSLAITATVGAVTFRIRKTATNTFIIYRT